MKLTLWKYAPAAITVAAAALAVLSCGEEQPGTNGVSVDYYPTAPGDRWTYNTYNLTRDPNKQNPIYTHVSVEYVYGAPGAITSPIFVTKYAKGANGEALRLNQAGYWVNKDIFFKYDYFAYGTDFFLSNGYHYLNEYRDPVIGTFWYNDNEQRAPMTLFRTPLQVGAKWDVLNRLNPDPNNPTVYQNMDQKEFFGLRRDIDNDGTVDDMDISIVGEVPEQEIIETDAGSLNCFKVVLTQTLVFHLSNLGDQTDVSNTTYWVAPNRGIMRTRFYEGSTYLDTLEMEIMSWWFVE
jgi:hypothetical protein